MLPSSHASPIIDAGPASLPGSGLLADAFSEFISASSMLESSYRDLQREVRHLGFELAERNAALTTSLAENNRMRAALQQIIDSMPCGVLVLDTAERIVTINPEGRRLLDLGSAQVGTLRDVARVSSVDLEMLVAGVEQQVEHEVCLARGETKRWLAISKRRLSGASLRPNAGSGKCE